MAVLRVGSKCSHTPVYAALSHLSRHSSLSDGGPPRAPDGKLGIYDLPSSLIHIFEIASRQTAMTALTRRIACLQMGQDCGEDRAVVVTCEETCSELTSERDVF